MPQEPVCRKVVPAKYKRATAHSIYAEKNGLQAYATLPKCKPLN